MDESAHQLTHELRHATASTLIEMPAEESPPPQAPRPFLPHTPTTPSAQQLVLHGPMEALQS